MFVEDSTYPGPSTLTATARETRYPIAIQRSWSGYGEMTNLAPLHIHAADDVLVARLAEHECRITTALAPYDPRTATLAWFETLRAVEELINLPAADWAGDPFENRLYAHSPVWLLLEPRRLEQVRQHLARRFTENFANRFANLMLQCAAIAGAFQSHGLADLAAHLATVGHAIDYFQSRRRHLVALLHTLPTACRGRVPVAQLDTLNIFLPIIEMEALQLMGAHNARLTQHACRKLNISVDTAPELDMLDAFHLEPERSRITEMVLTEEGRAMLQQRETLPPGWLFSGAELRNDLVLIEAAYAEFDLEKTAFGPAAALVRALSTRFIDRDFWIEIKPAELARLCDELAVPDTLRSALTHTGASYFKSLSTYAPLILVAGTYRSTVTLLSRFAYWWRARTLDRIKRFQIRAGFLFEDTVSAELEAQGFELHDITRINHREFDVVTTRGETIWNIQCKNNFTDLDRVDTHPARFARYNKGLVRAYERALVKERARETLLQSNLGLERIEHVVVSRFPVLTTNPRIIPFNRLPTFTRRADAIERFRQTEA